VYRGLGAPCSTSSSNIIAFERRLFICAVLLLNLGHFKCINTGLVFKYDWQKAVTLDSPTMDLPMFALTVILDTTVLEELQNLVQPVRNGKHQKQDQPAPPTIAHMVRQY